MGLRHKKASAGGGHSTSGISPNSTNGTSGTSPDISENRPSWRRDPLEYNLDRSWDINAAPTTRVFNLTSSEIQAAPDGVLRPLFVINGQFPGPLIRVNQGDRVLVNVTNQLSNGTSMHWHGFYQNGTNWMDGTVGITQCAIPPGESFLYDFTVKQFGTYWYHSHFSSQYTDGLVGPFIVHSPEESKIQEMYDYDQVVLLQDYYHDLSAALLPGYLSSGNENAEPLPDNGLIQGTNFFNCSSYDSDSGYACDQNSTRAIFNVAQGKRYRFRLINTGAFGEFQVSIDNHTIQVIEADSTLVHPVTVNRLPIHVAQRYSILFHANQTTTNYWFRARMNDYCFSDQNPVLDTDVRALITYTNSTSDPAPTESVDWTYALDTACEDLAPSSLIPYDPLPAPQVDITYPIEISFQIGDFALDKAYINSTTWVPPAIPTLNQAVAGLQVNNANFTTSGVSTAFDSSQLVIDVPTYKVIDVLINSLDEGAHPFHLHGHQFWIMASGAHGAFNWNSYPTLNMTNPMRRDTITVDAFGWALIRFKADNPGLWALHCHISWHMEAGLLMQFQTRNDIMRGWAVPSDVLALCHVK
ncbi:multicopper oxidase [Hyaloscypha bicolor E]|uniref:Multicopper oxidase n=1 Tax=Hyaloscypha bicolor E TaxID=1095630 RepID=A0A2J6SUQ3_9HELO|nr:multicopper oxidase [Hyaloscypha bicolor E]PMD54496.1 multicopper oxidase [Hyaloscypha bicolor E]